MTWEGPGFVDHHAHLLRAATGTAPPYGSASDHEAVRNWHRLVSDRWSTPMDEAERPAALDDQFRGTIEGALERAAAVGLVEITEAGMTDWAYMEALLSLRARGQLSVRVRLLVASGIAELARMRANQDDDPFLQIIGVKFYADGWLGSRTCALSEPFLDEPDDSGILFLDADTLARRADPYAEAGFTIATHAIGDRAVEAVLDGYQRLYGYDCAAAAPRIEHAQVLRPELIRRMAEMGVTVCIQPSFAVSDAPTARKALGGELMEHSYHWDLLLEAGVKVIAGSDYPIEDLAPLAGLQRLVTGSDVGRVEQVAETLTLSQALAMMTDAAAGTTVLSEDPHDVDEDEIAAIEVVEAVPNTGD